MKYKLNFDLNYFKVVKPTRENNDEIYVTGFGVNEFGNVDVIPFRRIYSNTVGSFNPDPTPFDDEADTVSGSTLIGGKTLVSTKLAGRRHMSYQVWLWIVESDDSILLKREFGFDKERLENDIRNTYGYDLRRDGYPEKYRSFQAVANNIMNIHANIQAALYEHGNKFELFYPITKFVNCLPYLNNNSDIQMLDLPAGDYPIDSEINFETFRIVNSTNLLDMSHYRLSSQWNLKVTGSNNDILVGH